MKKIAIILLMMFTVSTVGCTGLLPSASADALNAVVSFAEGQQQPKNLQLATVSNGSLKTQGNPEVSDK